MATTKSRINLANLIDNAMDRAITESESLMELLRESRDPPAVIARSLRTSLDVVSAIIDNLITEEPSDAP